MDTPWKVNMEPTAITHLDRKMIFQTSMIMFHLNLQGCNFGIHVKFQGFDLLHFGISFEPIGIDTRVFLRAEFEIQPQKGATQQLSSFQVKSSWNHVQSTKRFFVLNERLLVQWKPSPGCSPFGMITDYILEKTKMEPENWTRANRRFLLDLFGNVCWVLLLRLWASVV